MRSLRWVLWFFFFFQAEDGIRDYKVTGVQTCALPIWRRRRGSACRRSKGAACRASSQDSAVGKSNRSRSAPKWLHRPWPRSEEHTSELQSPCNLVCRLLLEKKKKEKNNTPAYKMQDTLPQFPSCSPDQRPRHSD